MRLCLAFNEPLLSCKCFNCKPSSSFSLLLFGLDLPSSISPSEAASLSGIDGTIGELTERNEFRMGDDCESRRRFTSVKLCLPLFLVSPAIAWLIALLLAAEVDTLKLFASAGIPSLSCGTTSVVCRKSYRDPNVQYSVTLFIKYHSLVY